MYIGAACLFFSFNYLNTTNAYYRLAYRIFADFSGTIAVPVVLAAILGKYLDERFATKPWIVIILLVLTFIGTGKIIKKKAIKYSKEYDRLNSISDQK